MDINEDRTPIQEFYRGSTILITGGTGFLGSVLIEKIMRVCSDFEKMYLIIRPKKEKDQKQRGKELFEHFIFSKVDPAMFEKVFILSGDCSKPMLGLSTEDQKLLQENVSIVFHSAATVRFDETLQFAVQINVTATRDIFTLAKGMQNLKAFVHVSTAFSNCHLGEIDEIFYKPTIEGQQLITLTECLNKKQVEQLTPFIIHNYPNTYVFTKSVTEELVHRCSKGIPVAVVRPSIIIAANKEPIPGWIDNLYGPSGVIVASGMGLMRTMLCDVDKIADVVPVDMVANAMISAAWNLDNRKNNERIEDPPIYNFVSSARNPIKWFQFLSLSKKYLEHSVQAIWYPFLVVHKDPLKIRILTYIWHCIPALLIDFIAQVLGKEPGLMRISQKIEKLGSLISYFSTRQWDFSDKNTLDMWDKLDEHDKELFPFDVAELNWDDYFAGYLKGVRQFLIKDDPTSISAGKKKIERLFLWHCAAMMFVGVLFIFMLWGFYNACFLKMPLLTSAVIITSVIAVFCIAFDTIKYSS